MISNTFSRLFITKQTSKYIIHEILIHEKSLLIFLTNEKLSALCFAFF